jgi:hypothetical protein
VEGTELTLTHSRLANEETRRSHEQGWDGALDKLQRHFPASSRGGLHDPADRGHGDETRLSETKQGERR